MDSRYTFDISQQKNSALVLFDNIFVWTQLRISSITFLTTIHFLLLLLLTLIFRLFTHLLSGYHPMTRSSFFILLNVPPNISCQASFQYRPGDVCNMPLHFKCCAFDIMCVWFCSACPLRSQHLRVPGTNVQQSLIISEPWHFQSGIILQFILFLFRIVVQLLHSWASLQCHPICSWNQPKLFLDTISGMLQAVMSHLQSAVLTTVQVLTTNLG